MIAPVWNPGAGNVKNILLGTIIIIATLLLANPAAAERKYFIEGLEITIPDSWYDIDSQLDFLKDPDKIAAYTRPSREGTLPLVRIIEVAAPGNDRGMLTFSIKPCYRGECPSQEQLQNLSQTANKSRANQKLITNDGSKLLEDYGMSVTQGCGGYFVTRGQKVSTPFSGVFISKSKMFYKGSYVIGTSVGYAGNASAEVVERTEAALESFSCIHELR